MGTMYFATNGNYGDAHGIVILDTSAITETDWEVIINSGDAGVFAKAQEIAARVDAQ